MTFPTELSIAVAAVRRAAEVCRNVQRAIPAAMEKQDKSPVTIADFASQAVICRALGERLSDVLREVSDTLSVIEPQPTPVPVLEAVPDVLVGPSAHVHVAAA